MTQGFELICSKTLTVTSNFSKVYVNRRTNIWRPPAARCPEGHGFSASVSRPEKMFSSFPLQYTVLNHIYLFGS